MSVSEGCSCSRSKPSLSPVCCFLTAGEGEEGRSWRKNLLHPGRNKSPALKKQFEGAFLVLIFWLNIRNVVHHAVRVQMGHFLDITGVFLRFQQQ